MKNTSWIFISFLLFGCAAVRNDTFSTIHDSYSYEENGCATGRHDFEASTKEEVHSQKCAALQNHTLNNYCAEWMRERAFKADCPEMTWQF